MVNRGYVHSFSSYQGQRIDDGATSLCLRDRIVNHHNHNHSFIFSWYSNFILSNSRHPFGCALCLSGSLLLSSYFESALQFFLITCNITFEGRRERSCDRDRQVLGSSKAGTTTQPQQTCLLIKRLHMETQPVHLESLPSQELE